jgi:hypothetical protein
VGSEGTVLYFSTAHHREREHSTALQYGASRRSGRGTRNRSLHLRHSSGQVWSSKGTVLHFSTAHRSYQGRAFRGTHPVRARWGVDRKPIFTLRHSSGRGCGQRGDSTALQYGTAHYALPLLSELWTADGGLWTGDCGLWTVDGGGWMIHWAVYVNDAHGRREKQLAVGSEGTVLHFSTAHRSYQGRGCQGHPSRTGPRGR